MLRDKQLALFQLIIENGKYGFFNARICDTCARQAENYAANDTQKALDFLEKAAYHAIEFVKCGGNGPYEGLIFRGYGGEGTFSTNDARNDAKRLLEKMGHSIFDPIRDHPRFAAVRALLSPYSADWKV